MDSIIDKSDKLSLGSSNAASSGPSQSQGKGGLKKGFFDVKPKRAMAMQQTLTVAPTGIHAKCHERSDEALDRQASVWGNLAATVTRFHQTSSITSCQCSPMRMERKRVASMCSD